MRYRLALLLTLVAVSGCREAPKKEWLAGSWVPISESCASDAGFEFDLSGQYRSFSQDGIWDIKRDTIELQVTGITDGEGGRIPFDDKSEWKVTIFKDNYFESEIEGDTWKWKRCEFGKEALNTADQTNNKQYRQKIIWENTGGGTFEKIQKIDERGMVYTADSTEPLVRGQCQKMGENLSAYLDAGWRIVSATPSNRAVQGGQCQGRDVVIERGER